MEYTWGDVQSPWLHGDISCWDALISGSELRKYKKKSFLYHEGEESEAAYVVAKGRFVVSTYHSDGSEKQICVVETGAVCGEGDCISGMPYSFSTIAIVDSEVYRIPAAELMRRIDQNPQLTRRLLEYGIRRSQLLRQHVITLSFEQASRRIAQTLLHIGRLYGKETSNGQCLEIKFTKNDIAGMVGTSRVTASSELSKMEQSGILIRKDGYYIITDVKAMSEIAGL